MQTKARLTGYPGAVRAGAQEGRAPSSEDAHWGWRARGRVVNRLANALHGSAGPQAGLGLQELAMRRPSRPCALKAHSLERLRFGWVAQCRGGRPIYGVAPAKDLLALNVGVARRHSLKRHIGRTCRLLLTC